MADAATGESVPAQELAALILGFASGFRSAGLAPGDALLVGCRLSPASTLAYLGAMYAGLVPALIEERVLGMCGAAVCAKTRARGVWTESGGPYGWIGELGMRHWVGRFEGPSPASFPPFPSALDDLAALMPTSGSTGVPRFVMVSHGNLIANTEAIIRSQELRIDERAMLILPLSYCYGASVVHTHLYQGGSVVFDPRFMFPDKVQRAINAYACTTFAGVPTVYNLLLGRSSIRSIPLPTLRRFLQAGGGLAPHCIQSMREVAPQTDFFVMYGQTEATARISCLPPDRLGEKLGSAGVPLDNLTLQIVDEQGRQLPPGQTGEVWAKGPSICPGYFDDAEETARKFQEGWLKTGDLACVDEAGFLWIKGRRGDFAKIRGVRLSFAEVEAAVAAIPGVCECAATAVPHPQAGEALSLYVVPTAEADGLAERVRRALPPQWNCSAVRLVAQLPKTSNGKLVRSLLKEIA